jgi:hypothetical protein
MRERKGTGKGQGTRKIPGRAWMYVGEETRRRLNLYKALIGAQDMSVTNQDETIAALLDQAGAPSLTGGAKAQP